MNRRGFFQILAGTLLAVASPPAVFPDTRYTTTSTVEIEWNEYDDGRYSLTAEENRERVGSIDYDVFFPEDWDVLT